jgi:hypothetical protein
MSDTDNKTFIEEAGNEEHERPSTKEAPRGKDERDDDDAPQGRAVRFTHLLLLAATAATITLFLVAIKVLLTIKSFITSLELLIVLLVVASQTRIGGKFFFRGWMSKREANAFAYNYKGDNPVRADQSVRLIICDFGKITERVWFERSDVQVQGKPTAEHWQKKRGQLEPTIRNTFSTTDGISLLPIHRALLTNRTLEGLLTLSYQDQLAWLQSVRWAKLYADQYARGHIQRMETVVEEILPHGVWSDDEPS